jgi:drug/metabolite transporter (DMT)-like permease
VAKPTIGRKWLAGHELDHLPTAALMSSITLALIAIVSFATSNLCLARGAQTSPTAAAVRLSVFVGAPVFAVAVLVSGQFETVPLPAVGYFAAVGFLHYIVGRTLMWGAVKLLGASRALVFVALSPVVSLVLAVWFLGESLAVWAILGASLAICGPVIMGRLKSGKPDSSTSTIDLRRGAIRAVFGSLAWGATPIFVKEGLNYDVPPLLGILIAYTTAAVIQFTISQVKKGSLKIRAIPKSALKWFILGSIFTNTAQLLLFLAYDAGDVTTVVVLIQMTPLLVTGMTFVLNRDVERITVGVVIGGLLSVAGAMLVVAVR